MKFRDWNKEYTAPTKDGSNPWDYSKSLIYDEILNCFHETQRPEDVKPYKTDGNTRLRDPFRKINKYKIQQFLGHMKKNEYKEVDWVEDDEGKIKAIILFYDLNKMSTQNKNVNSFCNQTYVLQKSRGDKYIKEMACYPGYEEWLQKLVEKHIAKPQTSSFFEVEEPITLVEIDNQLKRNRTILENLGFTCIDNIITSFADVYGIWVKGGDYTPIERAQQLSLQKLDVPVQDTSKIMEQILKLNMDDFANHYSNYNKGNSWRGMVVKGYGGLVDFIIKPAEMTNSWKKENKEKLDWKVEDTPLRKTVTEVEHFVKLLQEELPHLKDEDKHIERIRILRLSKGEGELERHTDRQDKDAGIGDGQWTRIHFPLQTNPDVKFTQWNYDGSSTTLRMGLGECWYLDMRKPHTAINFGDEDRYHLIIDIQSNSETRRWLEKGADKYPTTQQPDDYIE
jgi:hypothetical protein